MPSTAIKTYAKTRHYAENDCWRVEIDGAEVRIYDLRENTPQGVLTVNTVPAAALLSDVIKAAVEGARI